MIAFDGPRKRFGRAGGDFESVARSPPHCLGARQDVRHLAVQSLDDRVAIENSMSDAINVYKCGHVDKRQLSLSASVAIEEPRRT